MTTTTIRSRPAIRATGLRKSFGEEAGKTTTVHILTTLIRRRRQPGRVAGHDVAQEPDAVREAIGVTGQLTAVDNLLTGEENLPPRTGAGS